MFLFLFLLGRIFEISKQDAPPCDHPIFCQGELLRAIQLSGIFNDSKTFVDMPLRFPPKETLAKFQSLQNHSKETLRAFVDENFLPAGVEVVKVHPPDWTPNPQFLDEIYDQDLKQWASEIHAIWLDLSRSFDHSLSCEGCFSSVKSPRPFIVPGGRFREYYYWDNLWILEGLLVSEMPETALDIIANLLDMIERFGFIWNGARIYYSKRSQPPVLSLMVYETFQNIKNTNNTKAMELLTRSYPLLVKEHDYWMTHHLCFSDRHTSIDEEIRKVLNCYQGLTEMPRPESYKEDFLLVNSTGRDKASMYKEITAGAETGWDFSSRFFTDHFNMSSINVSRSIPVDLNSILYKAESILGKIASALNKTQDSKIFNHKARHRKKIMMRVLYNSENSQWNDVYIDDLTRNSNMYSSNFIPLWAFENIEEHVLEKVLLELNGIQAKFKGGMPTSFINSSQQWDFPNAWPPLQDFLIFGLNKRENKLAKTLSFELAQKFIANSYCGWHLNKAKTGRGAMLEKYNALSIGNAGHGGEYEVQEGFGWTNGVALKILKHYGKNLKKPQCDQLEFFSKSADSKLKKGL